MRCSITVSASSRGNRGIQQHRQAIPDTRDTMSYVHLPYEFLFHYKPNSVLITPILTHKASARVFPRLHTIAFTASGAPIPFGGSINHFCLPAVPTLAAPPPGLDSAAACQLDWRLSIPGSTPFCSQVWSLLCQAAMAELSLLLCSTNRAASAK